MDCTCATFLFGSCFEVDVCFRDREGEGHCICSLFFSSKNTQIAEAFALLIDEIFFIHKLILS